MRIRLRLRHVALLALAAGSFSGLGACSGGDGDAGNPADTLTRRQRDSILGEQPIPGARGVRGALRASDSADARNRRLDSIAGSRP